MYCITFRGEIAGPFSDLEKARLSARQFGDYGRCPATIHKLEEVETFTPDPGLPHFVVKAGSVKFVPGIPDEDWRIAVAFWAGAGYEVKSRHVKSVAPVTIDAFRKFCADRGWNISEK